MSSLVTKKPARAPGAGGRGATLPRPRQRARKQRGIAKDEALMVRVAQEKFSPRDDRPYHSDREVARKAGVNIQAVNTLMAAAFEKGVLSIQYNLPRETRDLVRLENAVRDKYRLQKVLLVPGLPDVLEPLDVKQRRNVQTHVIRAMAHRVAEYLDSVLMKASRQRDSLTLGVAWGRTMWMIAQELCAQPRALRFPGLEAVPIVGITCESLREPTEANIIAMRFAEAYGGQSSQLACPAFVPHADVWAIKQHLEQVRRMLNKLPTCEIVITSMGPIPDDDNAAQEITISSDPKLNGELFKGARTWNAVGEICYWLFDKQGGEVQTGHTAIGLGFSGLQKIAADPNRQVVLVAGGDQRRFVPLRAALRARLASVLVSDTVTARFLVGDA